MGSPRFSLNFTDLGKVLLFGLMVGIAAMIVSVTNNLGVVNLGSWQPLVVAGLSTVLELVRQWLSNNDPNPPKMRMQRR